MSEQRNPLTAPTDGPEQARRRKARRDRAPKPVAADYAPGDLVVVQAREGNGFQVHALAEVVDVCAFASLRHWRREFNLVARILRVTEARYQPVVGHLWTVDTDPDCCYYFGGQWVLTRTRAEEFPA